MRNAQYDANCDFYRLRSYIYTENTGSNNFNTHFNEFADNHNPTTLILFDGGMQRFYILGRAVKCRNSIIFLIFTLRFIVLDKCYYRIEMLKRT